MAIHLYPPDVPVERTRLKRACGHQRKKNYTALVLFFFLLKEHKTFLKHGVSDNFDSGLFRNSMLCKARIRITF